MWRCLLVEDEAAASHGPCLGQQPAIQPIVCFALAVGTRPVPTRGGTNARGPGFREMTWRRGALRGGAIVAPVLVGPGVGSIWSGPVGWAPRCSAGICPSHCPPARCRSTGVPERAGSRWSPCTGRGARARDARTALRVTAWLEPPRPSSWHRPCRKNPPRLLVWFPFGLV